ncbi:hypothetical protein [Streptomyces sp. NRRL S-337]|uniref:hypothetical protein n=1 Tax=Streptomyces sp. NRRL S-337 TaxID=1463900 RepID=UPI00131CAE98|nr:hypothetical protein [Streptomyces sp. NRRL S-337]
MVDRADSGQRAEPAPHRKARPRLWRETNAGLRFVLGHRVLRALAVKGAVTNLALQLCQTSFLVLCTQQLCLPVGALGMVMSPGGIGGFRGALLAPVAGRSRSRRLGHGRTLRLVGMLTGPLALLTPFKAPGPLLWAAAAGWMLTIFRSGLANVLAVSTRQTVTLAAMLGRMNATYRFLPTGALSVGALLAGRLHLAFALGG